MVKASGPGRRNPMIKIRELVSTVGSLRYEEVDGVRKEKERLTTDHQSYLHITSPRLNLMSPKDAKRLTP